MTGHVKPEDVDEETLANLMVGREVILSVNKPPKQLGETLVEVQDLTMLGDDGLPKVNNVSFSMRLGGNFGRGRDGGQRAAGAGRRKKERFPVALKWKYCVPFVEKLLHGGGKMAIEWVETYGAALE